MDDAPLFITEIPLRWGDMDAEGHVNNAVYFTYLEQARMHFLKTLELNKFDQGVAPVVVHQSCTYLKQLFYPNHLRIEMFADPPGNSSVNVRYKVYATEGEEQLVAEAQSKMVWIDVASAKSTPMPEVFRQAVSAS